MNEALIISACRTPTGRFLGGLSREPATELGATVTKEAVKRAGVEPAMVEEAVFGNVLGAGLGQAPARQVALKAGLPPAAAAVTVNKVCGSGLKAVMLAAQAIRAGDTSLLVAGGLESMSRAPFLLRELRPGIKLGNQTMEDAMLSDGLMCAYEKLPMGCLADRTAEKYDLDRAEQDRYAVQSHIRAAAAEQAGRFKDEIVPVETRVKKKSFVVTADEPVRPESNAADLGKLPPAFGKNGTVTAGNSSALADGAAALVVASHRRAEELGLKPTARIVAYAVSGEAPADLFIAPVKAVGKVCEKADLTLNDIDLIELNEAFAVQALACLKLLKLDEERVNVNGGAVALGHPIGASGARILVTLVHELRRRGGRYGLAALCLGGGNAVAMLVESMA